MTSDDAKKIKAEEERIKKMKAGPDKVVAEQNLLHMKRMAGMFFPQEEKKK